MPAEIDFNTATWMQVSRWAAARLDVLRTRNDGDLDPVQTASLRGQIQVFKELLGLPQKEALAKQTESANSSFGGSGY